MYFCLALLMAVAKNDFDFVSIFFGSFLLLKFFQVRKSDEFWIEDIELNFTLTLFSKWKKYFSEIVEFFTAKIYM